MLASTLSNKHDTRCLLQYASYTTSSADRTPVDVLMSSCSFGSYLILSRPCARVPLLIPGVNPFHRADRSISTLVGLALRVILTLFIYADAAVVLIVPSIAIPGLIV